MLYSAETCSPSGEPHRPNEGCSLSLRERVRVRGNGPAHCIFASKPSPPSSIALSLLIALTIACSALAGAPVPLVQAHAHNDYEHARPLLDALDHGFCSIEADVYLVDGQLLVAHDRDKVKPDRTLQALYLNPLRERVKTNGGRVFAGGPEVTLLVDLKTPWRDSYPALRALLKDYASMLTRFDNTSIQTNAVRVVITGSHSNTMFSGESARYAALDGEIIDLNSDAPASLIPLISGKWSQEFKWRGKGPMPEAEKLKLQGFVAKAHQQGRKLRFWGAPDNAGFWRALQANGVDLINTDNLAGLQQFLSGREGERPREP